MSVKLLINNTAAADSDYITWSPVPCSISADGLTTPLTVRLKNQNTGTGGQVVFIKGPGRAEQDELQLTIPLNEAPVTFFIAGKFPFASEKDKDVIINVIDQQSRQSIHAKSLMVRIRKNANKLTDEERDLFLDTLAQLNSSGEYQSIRNTHQDSMSTQAHHRPGFFPWHRAYLLDLERALQKIEPAVALPYWKFDEAAPNVFNEEFMGETVDDTLNFSTGHPFKSWQTDGVLGIDRSPDFDQGAGASFAISEVATMNYSNPNHAYKKFMEVEGPAHDNAHGSFNGSLGFIQTAAKDPLFFLLHANVDRLWAKWQWHQKRYNPGNINTYAFQGTAGGPGSAIEGHNSLDTMWPWNQLRNNSRPNFFPRGLFPQLSFALAPSQKPAIREVIDYQGKFNSSNRLGFDYDDIDF
jgi:tyrosinase